MRSCLQSDIKCINGVAFFPFVVFVIFVFKYQQFFWRSFIAFIRCSSSNLRSIDAIFSSLSRVSVELDFIALRISFMAPHWALSRSFICLNECVNCSDIIVPYSNFDLIKYLYIFKVRSGCMSGKRVNGLHT